MHAWPKLWKHQASAAAAELTTAAVNDHDGAGWLAARYGGKVGAEWLHPKALEVHDRDRKVFDAADVFVEAGDWFNHRLVHGPRQPKIVPPMRAAPWSSAPR